MLVASPSFSKRSPPVNILALEDVLLWDNLCHYSRHINLRHKKIKMIKFHLAQGVGYATMTIVFWLDIYYCIIISWTLYYLIMTFIHIPELPWRDCGKVSIQSYIHNDTI